MRPLVNGQMPKGDIFGGPPARSAARRAPPAPGLDTINERPKASRLATSVPVNANQFQRGRPSSPGGESIESEGSSESRQQHKKVQKGQINSLAKLLTSFSKTTRSRD